MFEYNYKKSTKGGIKMGEGNTLFFAITVLTAGISLGIAALGGAMGQGNATAKAVEGVARQPEASGKIMTLLILGLAMIESLTLYALVIALILLYGNPLIAYVIGK